MVEYYEKIIKENSDIIKKISDGWDYSRDYMEYERALKKYYDIINIAQAELSLIKEPILSKPLTKGSIMTLKDFVECVESGGFIDYDGSGNYYKDGKVTDISIYPSYVKMGKYRKDFDKIMWYNR